MDYNKKYRRIMGHVPAYQMVSINHLILAFLLERHKTKKGRIATLMKMGIIIVIQNEEK